MSISKDYSTKISVNDEMMKFVKKKNQSEDTYFTSGLTDIRFFVDSIKKCRPELLTNIDLLEFGCGHGRISRHVRNFLGVKNLAVSDVWDNGVEFCSKEFAATPFVITEGNPISKIGKKFDVIISYSVFSHLEPISFESTLSELSEVLDDGGLLLFSVKGERLARDRGVSLEKGYVFRGGNETDGRLSPETYAGMFVSEVFMKELLQRVGFRLVDFAKRDSRQDVYVVEKL